MSDFDLNIENYELKDILNLFRVGHSFTEADLKRAHRMALKVHPDKSGLSSDYFRFYMKAYGVLKKIFYFRERRNKIKCTFDTAYDPKIETNSTDKAVLLHSLNGKSISEFNDWFNLMFEKVKLHDEESDSGYADWINSNKVEEQKDRVALSEFEGAFEKKKAACKSLIKYSGVQEADDSPGYTLSRDKIDNYSSKMFSKLPYEDFKKAHTETVVPVTHEDFVNRKKFDTVDTYKRYRDSQNVAPPSLQQSQRYLEERSKHESELNSHRAFSIIKRDEELERCSDRWWSNLQRLTG